ncbi:DUF4007 family protein [Methylobacterium sp. AMS5]|uniref:DUF4007 family protein n=1 Tax=Methylobacterium sp. AMS5 TaxID=925818 RepID=UPI000762DBF0|nr:DUF4007 family protein [Methylobacterium sp. AMS5]
MVRGPLYQTEYRPQFSGHETFPLRYGWLKKAYDAISATKHDMANKQVFLSDDSIARLGVGKNMVSSIRHWATVCGIIEEDRTTGQLVTTPLGDLLFGSNAVDPYLESSASLWLIHWCLCANASKATTWFWTFSHYNNTTFKRDDLVDGLMKVAEGRGWQRVSRSTVQRDVECFVRTYESRPAGAQGAVEDSLESPLAELGLVRGLKGHFQIVRSLRSSLPDSVFAYALNQFWNAQQVTTTLSYERIAHEPGSPGRIFVLDETELATRLGALEDVTRGLFQWSETAGLKQVIRERALSSEEALDLLRAGYPRRAQKDAA